MIADPRDLGVRDVPTERFDALPQRGAVETVRDR
jgi:hypothetical protein